MDGQPRLRSVVLDSRAARALAEFYRQLLGYEYRAGDEPPAQGEVDHAGQDWLVLEKPGSPRLAFQQVDEMPASTWPSAEVPQQLHLDLMVSSDQELAAQRDRALALGARLLLDRSHDTDEPLHVLADPDGHPFCIFVGSD